MTPKTSHTYTQILDSLDKYTASASNKMIIMVVKKFTIIAPATVPFIHKLMSDKIIMSSMIISMMIAAHKVLYPIFFIANISSHHFKTLYLSLDIFNQLINIVGHYL